ncbi:retrovirus-related pol polyprotein from transposon TNT 1-94 [Tanacetum coccineum]|uniref:Retrovirus-related pol polyprotein from transposon TNT 1-94 n=1 Tax=Tanacetum coccineum TaxID=301880 RepID=A0ABQ5I3E4_9ASTR
MFINHEKYTLVIVDEYSRMVENQKDVKVKQIKTDNRTEFINSKLENFCDEKEIYQNFSSPYILKQNGVAERKNKTLIEAARTMLNGLSMEAIRFTNTLVDEIGIDDSSRYLPDKYFHEDDPFKKYQANFDISYYITPHGHSLTKLTKATHAPEVITPNEQNIPQTKDVDGPPDQDRWSRDQHIELVNIIDEPTKGMLIRSMDAKLIAALASECLFINFLSKIEPKKVFMNKKDELGTVIKYKARLVAQGFSQEEGINYDETFAPVARIEAIRIFLDFATYMNFIFYQMDVKRAFLNGKLKYEVYVKQPPGFESSEFPDYVFKLDKALYGLKQAPRTCSSIKISMVPLNNLGPDLTGKLANLKESHLIAVKRILKYLKGTPSLGLWYPKCLGFDLKGYSDLDYVGCNMERKSTPGASQILRGKLVCWSAKKQ